LSRSSKRVILPSFQDARESLDVVSDNSQIRELVEKIRDLPIMDKATLGIISLLDDPESKYSQILERLTPDLTAEFLKMANSAYYGVEVRTIDHALRMLGYEGMKQILVTSVLIDHFAHSSNLKNFNFVKFDKTARFCSALSRILGDMVDYKKIEDLFTVSMLHNVGKMAIVAYFNEEYKEIVQMKKSERLTEAEAEKKVLGMNHAEIGGIILERFHIPKEMCNAVKHHNLKTYVASENDNYELEMIVRESATLLSKFELPELEESSSLLERMKETVKNGRAL